MSRIIFFGTPDYVVCVPQALKDAGHEIVGVVTQPPKPAGRKQVIASSPIDVWAREQGIRVLDKQIIGELKNLTPEVGVLASYGKIVTKEVLDIFPKGVINIHPSLLPKWRGAAPVQEQVLAGEKNLGISLMLMDERMDTGPILDQSTFSANNNDTQQSLLIKGFKKGAEMLVKILPLYVERRISPKEQDHSEATYTYKTSESKEKSYFDINNPPPAEKLDRMIRAFYPWPVCWTKWYFDKAQDKNEKVVKFYPGRKIQMEGKSPVDWKTFKRAYPEFPLEL